MKLDDLDKVPDPRKPGEPSDVRPVRKTAPVEPVHRRGTDDGTPEGERRSGAGIAADGDRLSVHGIPEAELTPAVRAALAQLMAEIGDLKDEVETLRRQRDYFNTLADQDVQAPVLNRRALEREVAHAMSLDDRFQATSTLAVLAVENLHEIEAAEGMEVRAAVLGQVGQVLAERRETGEVVGRLGEGVFGVIMTGTDPAAAAPRVQVLADGLAGRPPRYRGRAIPVRLGMGLHALERGERVETALAAADNARRSDRILPKP